MQKHGNVFKAKQYGTLVDKTANFAINKEVATLYVANMTCEKYKVAIKSKRN